MSPHEELIKARLEADGWTVFKTGFPDFMCFRKRAVLFVEAKCGADRLSDQQHQVHEALRSAQLPVLVMREDAVVSKELRFPIQILGGHPNSIKIYKGVARGYEFYTVTHSCRSAGRRRWNFSRFDRAKSYAEQLRDELCGLRSPKINDVTSVHWNPQLGLSGSVGTGRQSSQ